MAIDLTYLNPLKSLKWVVSQVADEALWSGIEHGLGKVFEHRKKIQTVVGYMKQLTTGKPSPELYDIYLDALAKIRAGGNPMVVGRLGHRLARLMGDPDPDDSRLNTAQALFAILVTHFPSDPDILADETKRTLYVQRTAERIETFMDLDDEDWEDWCDVLNLTAPEKEKVLHRMGEWIHRTTGLTWEGAADVCGDQLEQWIEDTNNRVLELRERNRRLAETPTLFLLSPRWYLRRLGWI